MRGEMVQVGSFVRNEKFTAVENTKLGRRLTRLRLFRMGEHMGKRVREVARRQICDRSAEVDQSTRTGSIGSAKSWNSLVAVKSAGLA